MTIQGSMLHRPAVLLAGLAAATLMSACAPLLVGGAVVGTSMMVSDRRTSGAQLEDQAIELKANTRVREAVGERGHVNTTSYNRIVLLTGEAATTEARDQVLSQVRAVNGVRRITNEIRIADPSSFGNRSLDSLITSAVKSRFVVSKDLDPSRVKVVTEASVVYLLGLVTHAEGDLAADRAATIAGVARIVKVFEYID